MIRKNLSNKEPEKIEEENYITDNYDNDDPSWNADSTRTFLYYTKSGNFGGVSRKNYMHVYAFEGDTICIGTNIYNSNINLEGTANVSSAHPDVDSIDIVMHDLKDNLIPIDINGVKGSPGYIDSYATELLAKTMESPKGNSDSKGNKYVPYTYVVRETGVYTFEFRSYSGDGGTNASGDINKQNGWVSPENNQGALIAAWDISVFNENNEKETGRTYADSLSFQVNGTVREKYYIMTNDNYIYQMKLNGILPYTFSFFANNRGITDSANGNIIYKSVKDLKNTIQFLKFGVNYTSPTADNSDLNKNFYIFFEEPSKDLQGYMYDRAVLPDPATNIKFLGSNEEIYEGEGGYFSFDVQEATTATLRLDFDIGDGNTYAPVEISDVVSPYSTNYFYWDGKDGNGQVIPAGDYGYDNIKYTVTTKMGEIHFPLIDVENMPDGITFTRINNIYDKNKKQIDTPNTIYDKTRNVIYYDETAIYYGEKITNTGATEDEITYSTSVSHNGGKVTIDKKIPFGKENGGLNDAKENPIYNFVNISSKNNKEYTLYTTYGKTNNLRVGDHSYLNNKINFKDNYENQSALINYLDSKLNPVGTSKTGNYVTNADQSGIYGVGGNYSSTTDYGIANYFTFTTSDTAVASGDDIIKIKNANNDLFNLQARVFYDESPTNGIYDKQTDSDHLLSDITLNLYKQTTDTKEDPNKTYAYVTGKGTKAVITVIKNFSEAKDNTVYELIKTAVTPLQGTYIFSGLEYNKSTGTRYLYQVIKPNSSWKLTSSEKNGANSTKTESATLLGLPQTGTTATKTVKSFKYGVYALYKYDNSCYGTEIQTFTVGGSGVKFENDNNTMTAIDVGYTYNKTAYELKIKKNWQNNDSEKETPGVSVFEISYNSNGQTKVYEERAISSPTGWSNSFNFLDTNMNTSDIKDWFVSAEYYLYQDKIFRHKYKYDVNQEIYETFVGDDSYFSLSDYYNFHHKQLPINGIYTMHDIPDFNEDGVNNWDDLEFIPESKDASVEGWRTSLPAGTENSDGQVVAPFNSVLDRNVGTAVTEISITNASDPATIEILKYTGDLNEKNYLSGATFRIYKGDMENVKKVIEEYDAAQRELNENSDGNTKELQDKLNKAARKS